MPFKSHGIYDIDIAPTNRSSCQLCSKKIGKDQPRGLIFDYNYKNDKFVCIKCTRKHIKELILKLKIGQGILNLQMEE